MNENIQEWVTAAKPANGPFVVTVTLREGNLTSRVAVKSYSNIKAGVEQAREQATTALAELRESVKA